MSGLPPLRNVNANDTDFEHIPNTRRRRASAAASERGLLAVRVGRLHRHDGHSRGQGPRVRAGGHRQARRSCSSTKRWCGSSFPIAIRSARRLKPGIRRSLPWFTIIGVLKDVKQGGVAEAAGTELYMLTDQVPERRQHVPGQMNIVVRSPLPLETLAPQYRQRRRRSSTPTLPIIRMRSMDDVVGDAIARPRFLMRAARDLRRPRAGAGGGRHLWRAVVSGVAADAGDRHPHGARRGPPRHPAAWCSAAGSCSRRSASCSASPRRSASTRVHAARCSST